MNFSSLAHKKKSESVYKFQKKKDILETASLKNLGTEFDGQISTTKYKVTKSNRNSKACFYQTQTLSTNVSQKGDGQSQRSKVRNDQSPLSMANSQERVHDRKGALTAKGVHHADISLS